MTRSMEQVSRSRVIWVVLLTLSLLIVLWQCAATCFWLPKFRAEMVIASRLEGERLRQFRCWAFYLPGVLQIGFTGLGMIQIAAETRRQCFGIRSAALMASGLTGIGVAIFTIVRVIVVLA